MHFELNFVSDTGAEDTKVENGGNTAAYEGPKATEENVETNIPGTATIDKSVILSVAPFSLIKSSTDSCSLVALEHLKQKLVQVSPTQLWLD